MRPFRSSSSHLFCLAALLTGFAWAHCYSPDLTNVTITCTEADPRCPDGQTCVDDVCRPPAVADGSDGVADGGVVDSSPPPTDQAVSGCAGGGGTSVGFAWACPGQFDKGQASKLCAAGFSIATDATGVNTTTCNGIDGFFTTKALGRSTFRICRNIDPVNFVCDSPPPGYDNRFRFGCGNLSQTYLLRSCQRECGSFDRAVDCTGSAPDYACATSNSIDDDANTLPDVGVLCKPGP
jgi:hypothetical protein